MKPSTVNQYCSILKLILDMAVQEKVINNNPMQGFKRLKVDESNKRSLTNEEIREILDESVLPMRVGTYCDPYRHVYRFPAHGCYDLEMVKHRFH